MSTIILCPFKGYIINSKEIHFGMSPELVSQQDGIPYKVEIDNIINEMYEFRSSGTKLTFIQEKFESIIIPENDRDNQVYIKDSVLNLFENTSIDYLKSKYKFLLSKNKLFVNFPEIGIIIWGAEKKKSKEGKFIWAYSENQKSFYENMVNC